MEKVFVYSIDSQEEFPVDRIDSINLDVELFNRGKSEEKQKRVHRGTTFPPEGFKFEDGLLKELTLSEKANRGLFNVPPDRKIENNQLVPKTALELLKCGLLTISDYKAQKITLINSKFDEALETVLARYPKHEPISWPVLREQATLWLNTASAGRDAIKPFLQALVSEAKSNSEDDISELANSIRENAAKYELFSGTCKKIKKTLVSQIENNEKTNVSVLYAEIEAIVIIFPTYDEVTNG
ncbi:hypothetical protein [Leptospira santarosai]|uniref:hypothetical protein n=1 Tax=Leptospira santarosai TaxID=28183 RepID=UPI0009602004|nr:hypothetical protein [Leptospira santarosai]ASV10631.1 hypothetical protein B2G51_01230 [Leptospira santarosai]MBW9232486.1 hypothetical protein [Leptospira santarosai]MDI7174768.1 hypothetical protein [Leptospira santarosai]MDI7194362.1 hypothetical protein [Leptospira santarosai]MDO6383600.1 hypothetical protein [Leptospira santarosai]